MTNPLFSLQVIRIIGDLEFWSGGSSGSIVKNFVEYCMEGGFVASDRRHKVEGIRKNLMLARG